MDLCEYLITLIKVFNCLIRIYNKPIAYDNALTMIKWKFISERQGTYVQDITVSRDTEKLGVGRK